MNSGLWTVAVEKLACVIAMLAGSGLSYASS
jgi:hypothetical protein